MQHNVVKPILGMNHEKRNLSHRMLAFLDTETAIMSAAILIISSIIAGYLPARMASRQEVLETIRVVE